MRRAWLVPVATAPIVLLLSAAPAHAVVEIDARAELRFTDACAATDGYWHASDDPLPPFESGELIAVSWSSSAPLTIATLAPQGVSESGELQVADLVFVLVAADRETILFEGEFVLVDPSGPHRRLELTALLDCSVVPYREVGSSDTAVPTAGPRFVPMIGIALLVLAAVLFIGRQARQR